MFLNRFFKIFSFVFVLTVSGILFLFPSVRTSIVLKSSDILAIVDKAVSVPFVVVESKAKDLKNLKKYGKRRIKSELYSKGIDAEYVEEAVSYLDEDEEDMLLPLVEKRLKGDFEKKNIDKCIRYFMYRGYGFSDIKNCIDNIKEKYGE